MATVEREDKLADAKRQGQAQFESIREMVERLWKAEDVDQAELDSAREVIEQDALSVNVRSGWYQPGCFEATKPEEYEILLCTGGPACRIVGTLSEHLEPDTAHLEVQDWFTPWVEYRASAELMTSADAEAILLEYARCFWFGE